MIRNIIYTTSFVKYWITRSAWVDLLGNPLIFVSGELFQLKFLPTFEKFMIFFSNEATY